jgi:hypothetical protein
MEMRGVWTMTVGVRAVLFPLIAAVAMSFSIGCGGAASDTSSLTGPAPNDGLNDLVRLLKDAAATNKKLPAKVQDLVAFEAEYPAAAAFLQGGSIVYKWGSQLSTEAGAETTVIAHEAEAATKGGWVLLQDGTIKQMTADEFKAAKK